MTGQPRSADGPTVALIEPSDGLTGIGPLLAAAGFSVDLIPDLQVFPAGRSVQLIVVTARLLPPTGLIELYSMLSLEPSVPTLLILEPDSEFLPEDDVTWLTWPVSSMALSSICRRMLEDSRSSGSTIRARSPGGASDSVLYREVVSMAAATLELGEKDQVPDLGAIRLLAERIHSQLLRDNGLVNRSLEPHAEFDLASHSANVAIIAGKLGLGLAVGVEDVVRVIMAGIVHDIGMARLPSSILRKPGRLSDEEQQLIRTHPLLGAELLAGIDPPYSWLPTIILQEHERMQGQGYPSGLTSSTIDPLAQIIGLADVFEALSHPRSYRSPYTALEALEQVSDMGGEYFEPGLVVALVNEISAFPMDSYVQLSTGEIAQVVGTNPGNILRPEIVIRWDDSWNLVDNPRRLDLAEMPDVTVARALLEAELPIT